MHPHDFCVLSYFKINSFSLPGNITVLIFMMYQKRFTFKAIKKNNMSITGCSRYRVQCRTVEKTFTIKMCILLFNKLPFCALEAT